MLKRRLLFEKKKPPSEIDAKEEELLKNEPYIEINNDCIHRRITFNINGTYLVKHIDKLNHVEYLIESTGNWYSIKTDNREFILEEYFYFGKYWFETIYQDSHCIFRINNVTELDYIDEINHGNSYQVLLETVPGDISDNYLVSIENLNLPIGKRHLTLLSTMDLKKATQLKERLEYFFELV